LDYQQILLLDQFQPVGFTQGGQALQKGNSFQMECDPTVHAGIHHYGNIVGQRQRTGHLLHGSIYKIKGYGARRKGGQQKH
jgi:hypothetical protein